MVNIQMLMIEDAAQKVEDLKRQYLRSRGWRHRCDLPGALWLWHKEIDGRLVAVDEGCALIIQEAMEL